jgi:hypothetical protein
MELKYVLLTDLDYDQGRGWLGKDVVHGLAMQWLFLCNELVEEEGES